MDDFQFLSDYYDAFVGADYDKIAAYIQDKLAAKGLGKGYGVDLGCGSGTLTFLLEKQGHDMIGIDRSEGMLTQVFDKMPEESQALFTLQDLTDFELYGAADFMVSTLDCLNYFDSPEDIDHFLQCCTDNLKDGGLLIFDFNTLYKYEHVLDGQNFIYETEEAFCVWENEFDGIKMYYDLIYFVQNESGSYERREDHQVQTFFAKELILEKLKKYGFDLLSAESDYDSRPVTEDSQRIVITAQKRSN